MNLYEKLNQAVVNVESILSERQKLLERMCTTQEKLDKNSGDLTVAIKERNELKVMTSVVPPPRKSERKSQYMEEKRAVFSAICRIPDIWIAPQGLAVLSGVDDETTAAILRRAAAVELIPIKHNGKRGRGSMYRWAS